MDTHTLLSAKGRVYVWELIARLARSGRTGFGRTRPPWGRILKEEVSTMKHTSKLAKRITAGIMSAALLFSGSNLSFAKPATVKAADNDNYAKLLQYSLYLYDANMCGDTSSGAISWRSNCHMNDEVPGGYHDAGDHVMFGLPQGYAASTINWSYYEYKDVYASLGLTDHFKKISKHFTDFFKKATVLNGDSVSKILYQKGEGGADHAYWGAPEQQGDRGRMFWATSGASDIAAEYAAALALDYINFGDAESLKYAEALYKFSCRDNQCAIEGTGGFYDSANCADDQAWAAAWLYVATKNESYLNDAKSKNTQYLGWAHAWGNVDLGAACIIAEQTKDWFDQQVVSAVAELMSTAGNMAYRLQTTTADDRVDWKRTEWNIIVHVSPRWLGTPEQAARFATDYVSAYCLARWYTMVDPARAATYEARASRCAAKFRDVITRSFVPTQFW